MTERLALYGGTFDPFHCGHIDPVRAIRESMQWSEVLYVPAFVQPFKSGQETSSPFHRHAMAVLGTADDEWADVSTFELERGRISYTVETLKHFTALHPGRPIDWIIGDDNLAALTRWRALEVILSLACFVVLRRGGTTELDPSLAARVRESEARGPSGTIVFADNAPVAISSTAIRERIRNREDARGLVPPRVERYIRRHRLYAHQEDRH